MTGKLWSTEDMTQYAEQSRRETALRCIEICRDREARFEKIWGQAAARLIAKDIAIVFGLEDASIRTDGMVAGESPAHRSEPGHETPSVLMAVEGGVK